jgi:hypothetical protein
LEFDIACALRGALEEAATFDKAMNQESEIAPSGYEPGMRVVTAEQAEQQGVLRF